MDQTTKPTWLELKSIIPLEHRTKKPTVEQITGLSSDTIKLRHRNRVAKLSARRYGMKLKHALEIADGLGMKNPGGP